MNTINDQHIDAMEGPVTIDNLTRRITARILRDNINEVLMSVRELELQGKDVKASMLNNHATDLKTAFYNLTGHAFVS